MIADATALRAEFDATFTEAPRVATEPPRRYLLATLGTRRIAFRLDELLSVLPLPALAVVPGAHPALLGVGAVRGRAAAVFALAALAGVEPRPCRWLALIDAALAVALEELAGIVESRAELEQRGAHGFITHAIDLGATPGGGIVDVIDAPRLASTLKPAQREGHDGT